MVTNTGWIVEEPDAGPSMPVTNFVLSQRAGADTGRTLGQVLARAAAATDKPSETPDPDERAASLLGRGYAPGALSQLMGQLGDVEAELQAEREKIAKGAQRAAIAHREHQAGRVDAWQMMRMMDGDEGDENRVRQLEHRARSLRARIADTGEVVAGPQAQRAPDPVAAAAQRTQQALAQVTEELRLKDQAAAAASAQLVRDRREFYAARGRRPFAFRGAARAGEAPDPDWERERALREAVSGVAYR
jgi:hypothetical protein